MAHALPHLLLRCNADAPSDVAIALRNGGYAVTKAGTDELALQTAAAGQVDGIVIELPSPGAVVFARRLESGAGEIPALIVSSWPAATRRSVSLRIVATQDVPDDLICAVDRMLADHEIPRHRAVHGSGAR